ncbi:MAG: 4-hydroxy-tetrahydrodipicolinate reductase [Porphyromonadaceae bacterium]|nr:4-hydroxy-tetrahydrodipicolinate reductase [Porphyromonadaceae bacterium]
MKICLIGYGRMGQMVERVARERGHEVILRIDKADEGALDDDRIAEADVAIEFTSPESAYDNCRRALQRGVPVVSGTTAWADGVAKLQELCREHETMSFLWASNFSLGVNLFWELNRQAACLMHSIPGYRLSIEEVHHIHKLDAPSGTAITLAEAVLEERDDLSRWELTSDSDRAQPDVLPITSIREGEVAGIHRLSYTSSVDKIMLEHEAFSREGFALGAVVAAEYASGHRGAHRMRDVMHYLCSSTQNDNNN